MAKFLRDTPLGQFIRLVSQGHLLQYTEDGNGLEILSNRRSAPVDAVVEAPADVEADPEVLAKKGTNVDDLVIVDWYSPTDPENPRNFSRTKKLWASFIIFLYTFVVYCTSSITTPSYPYIAPQHGLNETSVSLILALYVLGYALGPLLFAPLSEIPWIGRNIPYWASFLPFLAFSIALTQVQDLNFATICVLRFLQGYFGSPILATGAASYDDLFDEFESPYGYMLWLGAMYAGPAVGPLLSGYAVVKDFRWPYWEVAIMAGGLFPLVLLLPETSADYILLQRAKRMRNFTSDPKYRAPSEIKRLNITKVFTDAMIKPTEIAIKDPAIAFVTVYGGIVYATYYSYFESFPLVYHDRYGLSAGGIGLIFLSAIIGAGICAVIYAVYLQLYFTPRARAAVNKAASAVPETYDASQAQSLVSGPQRLHINAAIPQEQWLIPSIPFSVLCPAGLFLFAWTATATSHDSNGIAHPTYHWIVPTIGIALFSGGSYVVFQCTIIYISLSYRKYFASLSATYDMSRGSMAAGVVMGSRAVFVSWGVDKGVSVLAGVSAAGVLGMLFLWRYGAMLRARSTFAER
ncbi:uncharacterized protein Z520_07873 [Fonsecaea multimorphosa CBS 102226]|uniref:Major facilitator superfamily (MFS) profile domain-containing protein n=1 Tax=Fonsecaea multimorphosa CBS 102226 TaxID=1442371 RepID=A0A0D2JT09_9EURO|nr:uncharacterized protein Z520_07873 [Fonsecaea multimorphosa CBS 102226]KIX96607.1 hypothetical protein Z520_07873 [Fonsecaea multimorphosa CBS 102226]OAL22120.1 hypothetical protein AYO22_07480 [Fonsecaea multimorphosa]